jgi:ATP-dependent RNA helicase TDRD9
MQPSAKSLVCGEHWSGRASGRFASLVSGCALLVKVFSVVHSVLHVDVYHYSGTQDMVNIRDVLISEGHAELAEECYESKVCIFAFVRARIHVYLPLRQRKTKNERV